MIKANMICPRERSRHSNSVFGLRGFTLIEVLVVLAIFSVLAAISLPLVRKMVSDQKAANTSRSIAAFIDATRRRAVSEGRPMGILMERLDTSAGPFSPGRSSSIRIRQTIGVPAYAGESSNAFAELRADLSWWSAPPPPIPAGVTLPTTDPNPSEIDAALFIANDNQLLLLSAQMIRRGEPNAPIQIGDMLELPGGLTVPILSIREVTTGPAMNQVQKVKVNFELSNHVAWKATTQMATNSFPAADYTVPSDSAASPPFPREMGTHEDDLSTFVFSTFSQNAKYKIHRSPTPSTTAPYDMPRGMVVDFNYSGIGAFGNQFAPFSGSPNEDISLLFGEDGRVTHVTTASGATGAPAGLIFFCLGSTDGIRDDALLSTEDRATANLRSLKSIWIVVNPSTGRVVSSPFASVNSVAGIPTPLTNPHATNASGINHLAVPINQARTFAFLSDTVDNK